MNRVWSVVVNWNRPEDTLECLQSLKAQTGVELNLVVVDNGSQDDSVRILRESFPQAALIVNSENKGFGGGYNQGVHYAFQKGAERVFIINNDAVLAPDALFLLSEQLSPQVGVAAPLIFYAEQPDIIWSSGGKVSRWNLEVFGDLRNKPLPKGFPELLEREFFTGCALMITRAVYEKTGLFDECFQMYYEDSDFCARTRDAGFKMLLVSQANAWHKVARSSGGIGTPNERYWMARSSIRFFRKNARPWQWPIILFFRASSAVKTVLKLIMKGRRDSAFSYLKGLKDGLLDAR